MTHPKKLKLSPSVWIALAILLAFVAYLATGIFGGEEAPAAEREITDAGGPPLVSVRVREMQGETIAREVRVPGRTEPKRAVYLRAEVPGQVEAILATRGEAVATGEPLLRLKADNRPALLKQAQAYLAQAQIEQRATQRLVERQLQPETAGVAAQAAVAAAEAALEQAELALENILIRAPFDGVFVEREIEVGDYVNVGDPAIVFAQTDPLIISGDVTEFEIAYLHVGETGRTVLASGQEATGEITYVSPIADEQTRTFRVELSVANADGKLPVGATAEIVVETELVVAHAVSPALIAIADDGVFGVKFVDDDNRVHFVAAEIVKTEPTRLWLTGLPADLRLITVGQGFVRDGDVVDAQPESELQAAQ